MQTTINETKGFYLMGKLDFSVSYEPSSAWTMQYNGVSNLMKNITEQYTLMKGGFLDWYFYSKSNNRAYEDGYQFSNVINMTNKYYFSQNIGLPLVIVKQPLGFTQQPLLQNLQAKLSASQQTEETLQLESYTWEQSVNSTNSTETNSNSNSISITTSIVTKTKTAELAPIFIVLVIPTYALYKKHKK